jgi:hypothetical protein
MCDVTMGQREKRRRVPRSGEFICGEDGKLDPFAKEFAAWQ